MIIDTEHKEYASDEQQVERLVAALCERLVEVLSASEFEVTVEHNKAVRILGRGSRRGNSLWLTPTVIWSSHLPVEHRLQLFLDAASRRVQKFASHRNRQWPTMTAKPRVSVGEDEILVWWGGESREDAVVALRPISRREIGV